MPKSRPFPTVLGGCYCGSTRYRLEKPPLFNYSCHCSDCQKRTGSVFACFVSIESEFVTSIGSISPKIVTTVRENGVRRQVISCPKCGIELWTSGNLTPVTADVRTGTLDHANLMEPDLHSFIESKIPWVILPEGSKTCDGPYDFRKVWPKASLVRYESAVKRLAERLGTKRVESADEGSDAVIDGRADDSFHGSRAGKDEAEDVEEADKTPKPQSPEEKEDDEEFEKRFQEQEKALQERLEKLTLKLNEQEKA